MTTTPPGLPSFFEQLMGAAAAAAHDRPRQWPMNPFPAGVRPGSASDRILQELRRVQPQALEHGQLRSRCQASHGAVSWGLRYLEHGGLVEKIGDPRHPQYRRWRAIGGGDDG